MENLREIDNINEAEIKIEGKNWEDNDVRLLWSKNELIFRNLADFWRPAIVKGKLYNDYMHGHIFDNEIRTIYEKVQKKICIEPRLMKPRINSLVGEIMKGKRSGKVTTEGGMSANELYLANMILKYVEERINEQGLLNEMLFNGCISCTPQILWFDYAQTAFGDQMAGLVAEVLPWDSFVLSKFIKNADCSDATTICRIARKSKTELIDENPDREDAIKEHYNRIGNDRDLADYLESTNGLTVDDARYLHYDILTGLSDTRIDGKMLTVERLHSVKTTVEVAISSEAKEVIDYQVRPGTWDDDRWNIWKEQNKEKYVFLKPKMNLLWQSRWTREGLMLQNKLHWFQEHDDRGHPIMPIVGFIPQIVDGVPTGPAADMQHKLLMKAIAETEFLHDIRCGTGDIFAYKRGSIVNYKDLPTELSVGNGIVQIDGDKAPGPIRQTVEFLKRTPNTAYADYSEKVTRDLEETDLINKGLQGQHVPDQSGKAKNTEIVQAVVGYSFLVENFNKTFTRTKNLECMLIPYVFTDEQVVELQDDEQGKLKTTIVNQKETDINDNVVSVANDLTSAKWRWRLIPGDDSPTARQAELNEMLIFWNTAAPTLIQADETLTLLASVLMSMGNKTAKDTGRVIAEKAKVQAEQMSQQQMAETMAKLEETKANAEAVKIKAQRSGFSFSVTPEDLAMIPGIYKILVDGNYINSNKQFQLPEKYAGQPAPAGEPQTEQPVQPNPGGMQ